MLPYHARYAIIRTDVDTIQALEPGPIRSPGVLIRNVEEEAHLSRIILRQLIISPMSQVVKPVERLCLLRLRWVVQRLECGLAVVSIAVVRVRRTVEVCAQCRIPQGTFVGVVDEEALREADVWDRMVMRACSRPSCMRAIPTVCNRSWALLLDGRELIGSTVAMLAIPDLFGLAGSKANHVVLPEHVSCSCRESDICQE